MPKDLLFEIGVEELPASFVDAALAALPGLAERHFEQLRLECGAIRAYGTPRRLALFVGAVGEKQADLDESVQGPPERVAFDAEGRPTPAARAFAKKLGVEVDALEVVETEKGRYLVGRRHETGRDAVELLAPALSELAGEIPFRKSMRWGDGLTAFGRPVRWLVALFGGDELPVQFAGLSAARLSQGHRFLAPDAIELYQAEDYVSVLREHHVVVDPEERRRLMLERLWAAATSIGGELIEDAFLVEENGSLVEEPQVVVGSFDEAFLELPERVILEVAKGHQRYFGVRDSNGRLLPRYLAVVGTALKPKNIVRGSDRVMRARLADARFFYQEDLRIPLQDRRGALDGMVFHKRLGTLGAKVARLERLARSIGGMVGMEDDAIESAMQAASLCKNDLVTLMVGELPELQGEMGRAYALAQGVAAAVADAISEHYQPRGADDAPPASDIGALLALADRIDTLAGCFGIGLAPSGAADPLALRRAAIGVLRILLAKRWPLAQKALIEQAYDGFGGVELDLDREACTEKLDEFLQQRLRGVLQASADVIEACMAAGAGVPLDVAERAQALEAVDAKLRAVVAEVFKRAANIAKEAPAGDPVPPPPRQVSTHPSERALFDRFAQLERKLAGYRASRDYASALQAIAEFSPVLAKFFEDVFVMVEETALRENRLRLMRRIHETCSQLADFKLLGA